MAEPDVAIGRVTDNGAVYEITVSHAAFMRAVQMMRGELINAAPAATASVITTLRLNRVKT